MERITNPKSIAAYLDEQICIARYSIDKQKSNVVDDVACDTCVRLRRDRLCVQLVTANGKKSYGIVPMPEERRIGREEDRGAGIDQ